MSVAVVSCVWKRPERLHETLSQLGLQVGNGFHLYLICNNPDLHSFVEQAITRYHLPVTVYYHDANRGPYARIEVMHWQAAHHEWFLTVDDDAIIPDTWMQQWRAQRQAGTLQGWQGWHFRGDYWQRETARPGEPCHYLWGSNMAVPAELVRDRGILDLLPVWWQCDDLWLCYNAHINGIPVLMADIDLDIVMDGKDTFRTIADTKRDFLSHLRGLGWQV